MTMVRLLLNVRINRVWSCVNTTAYARASAGARACACACACACQQCEAAAVTLIIDWSRSNHVVVDQTPKIKK